MLVIKLSSLFLKLLCFFLGGGITIKITRLNFIFFFARLAFKNNNRFFSRTALFFIIILSLINMALESSKTRNFLSYNVFCKSWTFLNGNYIESFRKFFFFSRLLLYSIKKYMSIPKLNNFQSFNYYYYLNTASIHKIL